MHSMAGSFNLSTSGNFLFLLKVAVGIPYNCAKILSLIVSHQTGPC